MAALMQYGRCHREQPDRRRATAATQEIPWRVTLFGPEHRLAVHRLSSQQGRRTSCVQAHAARRQGVALTEVMIDKPEHKVLQL